MSITMDKLVADLQTLKQRKEETLMNFHQILGAISILEQMIATFVQGQKPEENMENNDGETHDEESQQAS